MWEIDLVGPIPMSVDGYRYLVTVIDHWSKRAYVGAVRSKSATEVTTCLLEAIRKLGVPKTILSDNGKEFSNSEMLGAAKELGIEWKFGAPYSPTATGLVERFNRTYTNKLKKISEFGRVDWYGCIGAATKAYNESYHREDNIEYSAC
jgi:transposase InsO family protein